MISGIYDAKGDELGISGFIPVGDPARKDNSGVGDVLKVDDGSLGLGVSTGVGFSS